MKEVARFYDVGDAEVAAGFLRSHGIDVGLPERHTLGAQPEMRFAFGGYRLMVSDDDASQATRLLDEVRSTPHGPVCPKCGAQDFRRARDWSSFVLASLLALSLVPFARGSDELICRSCQSSFKEEELDEPQ